MISRGWIISHRCSWITVYVLCCNAQMNLIVIFMTCTCIVMHSLFCRLSNCNLFTQHVISLWRDTSSELWTLVHSFTLYYHLVETLFIFRKYYFTSLQINISFYTVCLIICFQQTREIDNRTVSLGKVVWLYCVQVPRCCWCRPCTINCLLAPCQKSASNNLQKWFLSPTGRLNFGFILREKLLLCSSYLPLWISQRVLWDINTI
jgi:hypothetical protein